MALALVVDDNIDIADTLCQLLGLLGVEARPAYGARLALLALETLKPDIAFLDINMPGLSGFEVVSYIQREPRLEGTPFVIVSAEDSLDAAHKAKKLGAVTFINKPATLEALEAALKSAKITLGDSATA